VIIDLPIRNSDRTTCAMLSGQIVTRHGAEGLPDGTIRINFTG
jgi:glutamate synthase domain-containing protein 3